MPGCLRCDPILNSGYQPGHVWPPGWGGLPWPIDPNALMIRCPTTPATAVCATPDVTATINGQNFTASCVAQLDGVAMPTTFISASSLSCVVPSSAVTTPKTSQITVVDPTLGTAIGSCPFSFTAAPILTMSCPLVPASAVISTAPLTVKVNGTLFTANTIVMLDGVDQPTTFISPTQVSFQLTPGATATTHTVSVKDGGTTAATTCPFQITLTPLLTVVCPVAPATAVAGTPDLVVTVNGTNFTAATQATWNGAPQATTPISATQISFQAPTSTAPAATYQVGAIDGANTAAVSCPFVITPIAALMPTVTSIFPDMVGASDPIQDLTITGTNFTPTSVAVHDINGDMPTTFVNATTLTVKTAAPPAPIHSAYISVRNDAVLSTTSAQVQCVGNPTVNALLPTSVAAGSAPFTLRVAGSTGDTGQILIDNVPVPTVYVSGGELNCTLTPPAAPGTIQVTTRMGHQHGARHDNVRPLPAKSLPFQYT